MTKKREQSRRLEMASDFAFQILCKVGHSFHIDRMLDFSLVS